MNQNDDVFLTSHKYTCDKCTADYELMHISNQCPACMYDKIYGNRKKNSYKRLAYFVLILAPLYVIVNFTYGVMGVALITGCIMLGTCINAIVQWCMTKF